MVRWRECRASFGTFKTDFNVAPATVNVFETTGSFVGSATVPGFAGRDEVYPGGFVGGGQIGYNWQFSPIWVVGLEADFQGADEKEHSTLTSNFSAPLFSVTGEPFGITATGTTVTNYSAQIDWFGTARLRAGYVWGDGNVFSYVTGGLAYGEVKTSGTSVNSGSVGFGALVPFSTTHAIGHSQVNTGWVVGSGTEGKLLIPGWTYKIEGLYMDLGTLDDPDQAIVACFTIPCIATVTGGQIHTHTHFTDTILRVGLNYQFH